MRFYCGAYTTQLGHVEGRADAIQICELDPRIEQLTEKGSSPPIENSSYLCLDRRGKYLYSISEITDYQGQDDGSVTVFQLDDASGDLAHRQTVSSAGPGPAYIGLDQTGKYLLLANYVGGNVVVYPIKGDGQLGDPVARHQHAGSSVNRDRQEAPHPHAIVISPDNLWVYVPDLGLDRIVAYRFDANTGAITPEPAADVSTPPGSGPRHLAFSPDDRHAFCTLELSSQLVVYGYDQGQLVEKAIQSTLPVGYDQPSYPAEVQVAPDGRHVYVSNRGHDSLAVFVRQGDLLKWVETASTRGKTPRHFAISPDGKWVIAANQDSSTLCCLKRDDETGSLTACGPLLDSPSPAMILFANGSS